LSNTKVGKLSGKLKNNTCVEIFHAVLPTALFVIRMTVRPDKIKFIDCNLNFEFKSAAKIARDVEMRKVDDEDDGLQKHQASDKIYIVDHSFALNQYDFIENCDALSNFVLPDTVLKYINKK